MHIPGLNFRDAHATNNGNKQNNAPLSQNKPPDRRDLTHHVDAVDVQHTPENVNGGFASGNTIPGVSWADALSQVDNSEDYGGGKLI